MRRPGNVPVSLPASPILSRTRTSFPHAQYCPLCAYSLSPTSFRLIADFSGGSRPHFRDEITEKVSRVFYCHPEVRIPEHSSQKEPQGSPTPGVVSSPMQLGRTGPGGLLEAMWDLRRKRCCD